MSSSPAHLVREFHRAFGLDVRDTPTEVAPELAAHRGDLLAEEAAEAV
jgi:predicted HAD superfamily Cof-like phosphohydrolase